MGALSNIDPTAVAVWASAVVLFALIAVLRAVFKLNFSLLTVLALGLGIALSLVFDGQVDSLNLTLFATNLPSDWQVVVCNSVGACSPTNTSSSQVGANGGQDAVTVRFTIPTGSSGAASVILRATSVRDGSYSFGINITVTR